MIENQAKSVLAMEADPKLDQVMQVVNSKPLAENMLAVIQNLQIIKPEDKQFLVEHKERWQNVVEKTFIWRTLQQKLSIIHDQYHPTPHAKFHQSILECKVFFEQAVELHSQAEAIKFELESFLLDKEEVEEALRSGMWKKSDGTTTHFSTGSGSIDERRLELKKKEINLKIQQKTYSLQQCRVQMEYRMKEIRDWKEIQDKLISIMMADPYNMTIEQIWDKQAGEAEAHFYLFLSNFQAVHQSKDTGEIQNLTALARHGVEQAMALGKFEEWSKNCDQKQIQSLVELGYIKVNGNKASITRAPDEITNDLYKLETTTSSGAQLEHKEVQ